MNGLAALAILSTIATSRTRLLLPAPAALDRLRILNGRCDSRAKISKDPKTNSFFFHVFCVKIFKK
jgi:hypothetical protein